MPFISSLFIFLLLQSRFLINKVLLFVAFVLRVIPVFQPWVSFLLVLIYLGGLFVVITYISSFTSTQTPPIFWLALFIPIFFYSHVVPRGFSQPLILIGGEGRLFVCVIILSFLLTFISLFLPSGKAARGGL